MYFEMNMLTGKHDKICYEVGDIVIPKGSFGNISAPKSLLLKKEHKHNMFSPDYLIFHEGKIGHGYSVNEHSMNIAYLYAFYEPYVNPLSIYK